MRRFAPRRLLVFAFLWATTGFFVGTLVLAGPVRWLTAALRDRDAVQSTEDLAVRAVILLLAAGTGWVAWRLAGRATEPAARRARWAIPAGSAVLAMLALAVWMNPRVLAGTPEQLEDSDERFVFGPYPDRERLAELKRRGFAGVVTLLHPAVVPFEPRLLADERAAAADVGMPLVEAPMLPWIGDNTASLARIRTLASDGKRYYVHCYLGRDRVNVVRRLLAEAGAVTAPSGTSAGAGRLAGARALERGPLLHLEGGVHVAPLPTDEEWVGYVLAGEVRQVLSLLDTASVEDSVWVGRERRLAREYRLPVTFAPVPVLPFDPQAALRAARTARALPRPLLVHAFRTPSVATQAFVQAYRSGLPPLPPLLFEEAMAGGRARVVGANVAAGPRPTGPEFGAFLHPRGVRGVVFLGSADAADARQDRAVARSAGLQWRTAEGTGAALDSILAKGGPWYVYGPALEGVLPALEARLDPGV